MTRHLLSATTAAIQGMLVPTVITTALMTAALTPAQAQQTRQTPPAAPLTPPSPTAGSRPNTRPTNSRAFLTRFQSDVFKGCMQSPKQGVGNLKGYCNCYAQSYVNRYTADDLITINRAASLKPENPQLVALMMRPEMRACAAANP